MEYLEGRTLGEEDLSDDLAREAGDLLRRFHSSLSGFRPRASKDRHDVAYIRALLDETAATLDAAEREDLDEVREAVLAAVGREEWADEALGVVHADYYVENLIRMANGTLALIDFDDSYYGTQLFDVAIGAMEFAVREDQTLDSIRLDGFLDGYGYRDDNRKLLRAMTLNCLRFLCYTLPLTRDAGGGVRDNAYAKRAMLFLVRL
jgi:Ser/Thr protein kinase RdoA (MazF antagonist)